MTLTELEPAKFKDLQEGEEFWKPVERRKTPKNMEDLVGPYYVYAATGHVLNKLFRLKKPLQDHELQNVALDDEHNEFYLMEASEIVYIRQ